MITRNDFMAIDLEVKKALQDSLDSLLNGFQNAYALFLADGEYSSDLVSSSSKLNPYTIDNRISRYRDETRLKFLSDFLNIFYSFPKTKPSTDDNEQRIHMELMIYSHIWEAQPFLKRLYRLAHLNLNEQYNWDVYVPPMGKHGFIIDQIRQPFEEGGSMLTEIIRNGFHTSLRNAFAHSDYSFDTMNGNTRIILHNYGGKTWELSQISFNDWSKRFLYSALLSYYLLSLTHKSRIGLVKATGVDTFQIKHPTKNGYNFVWIKYDVGRDRFSFDPNY